VLKKSASGVLASLRGSTYSKEYASPLHSLRPCRTAFLNTLESILETSVIPRPFRIPKVEIDYQQPARVFLTRS
jgi:hypothetical protein